MYYGPDLNIEYDREWFEPEGDQILVMQQHCGGENFLVFKGFLQPDGNRNDEGIYIKTEISFFC
jgi:hypothetical protein